MGRLPRFRELLAGRPPTLPGGLDGAAERWADLPPRGRIAAGATAALLVLLLAGAGAARSPWGPPTEVLVAARDLPAGHVVQPGDVRPATWPSGLVPEPAADPVDATLRVGVPAGTALTADHLTDGGIAGLLTGGEAAFPLPLEDAADLHAGQRVDLVAGDPAGAGLRLAADARVLAVDGAVVWVAVPRDDAATLAGAAAWGRVVAVPLAPAARR